MKKNLTLAEIAGMESVYLTPDEAAAVIGCEPHKIRVQAATQEGRDALGFPVIRLGNVTKVLRIPFLRYLGWEGEIRGASTCT